MTRSDRHGCASLSKPTPRPEIRRNTPNTGVWSNTCSLYSAHVGNGFAVSATEILAEPHCRVVSISSLLATTPPPSDELASRTSSSPAGRSGAGRSRSRQATDPPARRQTVLRHQDSAATATAESAPTASGARSTNCLTAFGMTVQLRSAADGSWHRGSRPAQSGHERPSGARRLRPPSRRSARDRPPP